MKSRQIERHQTLREKILETIREAILKGDLKPGEKVAEPELAERFGISRTPIREAFRQLESEGYLTVIPRKGLLLQLYQSGMSRSFMPLRVSWKVMLQSLLRKTCQIRIWLSSKQLTTS